MFDANRPDLVIGVVGAGQMGRGIAQLLAQAGVEVRVLDARPGAAEDARAALTDVFQMLAGKGRMTADAAEAARARLRPVASKAGLAGCHAVVEAIVEDLAAKRALFAELEAVVGADCVLATNTSSLSVTAIAAACEQPGRVAGLHFFNPAPLMRVVEVVAGARTAPAALAALAALARRFGHRPVRVADMPGFLVNHAGRGYGLEALRTLAEGVAAASDIDRILREGAGFPMGPFELLDLTGLDVSHPVMETIYRQFYDEPRFQPVAETARRLAAGLLGRKSGEGFYRYEAGRRIDPPEPPPAAARPTRVWISPAEPEGAAAVAAVLGPQGAPLATGDPPGDGLLVVTPFGTDASAEAAAQKLDPTRTVAVDTLLGLRSRITLMTTPLTTHAAREAAHGLFAAGGTPVTPIEDSPGFVVQRVLAAVVNVACDIAQRGIAAPDDIDDAVRLGLGYPKGPLAWGDEIGPARLLRLLKNLHDLTGEPRFRPSPWLRRRAELGASLLTQPPAD